MEGTKLLPTSQAENSQITPAGAAAGGGGNGHAPTASLHSVRKPTAKPWRKPAPLPIPPKVYRVDPRGFRELVQRLTGATALAPRGPRMEAVPAPPPAPVQQACDHLRGGAALWSSSPLAPTWELPLGHAAAAAAASTEPGPQTSSNTGFDPYSQLFPAADFPSPSLYAACLTWCSSPLLSPGSMACLEQSTVL